MEDRTLAKNYARNYIDEICTKYPHAVFDMDGTLIDSMPVWKDSARNFLRKQGIEAASNLNQVVFNLSLLQGAKYIQKTYLPNFTIQQIIDGVESVVEDGYKNFIPLKDGVFEFLSELKNRGIPCAIATSTDLHLARFALERLNIADFFSDIYTCSQLQTSKDKPDIYIATAKSIGGDAKDTIVFEDILMATKTATNAGFTVAAIYDEFSKDDWSEIQKIATYSFIGW